MIGLKALESRLKQMWAKKREITVIDLVNDFYVIKFNSSYDYEHAIENGPWMIYDHYLMVRMWCSEFDPWTTSIKNVMVWGENS